MSGSGASAPIVNALPQWPRQTPAGASLVGHSSLLADISLRIPMPAGVKPPRPSLVETLRAILRVTEADGSQWINADEFDAVIAEYEAR